MTNSGHWEAEMDSKYTFRRRCTVVIEETGLEKAGFMEQ
jgi:hypothetical protein